MATLVKSTTTLTTANDTNTAASVTFIETAAAGANFFKIQDTAQKATLILRGSSDTVLVENLSDAFQIKVVGKTVFLNGDSQLVQLNLTKPTSSSTTTTVNVEFLDGSTTIVGTYASGKVTWKMGGQTLSNKYADFVPTTALGTATNAETAFDDSSTTTTTTSTTYTLTTGVDSIAGGTGDNIIYGLLASAADSAGTMSIADQIDGGAGTDTLYVTITNTAAAASTAPITSGIEVVTLRSVSENSGQFSMANMNSGVTALNLFGASDVTVVGVTTTSITLSGGYTKTAALTLKTDTTADAITLNVGDASSAGLRDGAANSATGVEVVNLAATAAFANDSVFDFQAATALNITGSGNVTLNFQAGTANFGVTATGLASGNGVGKLGTVNASALAGNLTLYISSAGIDQSIIGGAGNDTFYASGGFNQSDALNGGAGTDALTMAIGSTGTMRPVITSVETLTVDFNASATIDMRNSTAAGIETLNVLGAPTAVSTFSALASGTKTINVQSGDNTGGLTFNYNTGAPSDVVINLTNQATSTSTASYDMGDLTVGNNTGSLTLNVVGSATGQAVDAFAANNASTLTVNVTSGQFVASAMNANAATTVTLNVGKTANITGAASFTGSTALNINITGASAAADFANIAMGAKGNLSVTLGSATTSLALNVNALNWGATASTASMSNSVTITNQGDGDVVLSALDLTTAGPTAGSADQVTFNLNVTQSGTGAVFAASAIQFGSVATASVNMTFAGQGGFEVMAVASTAAAQFATAQFVINATGLNTAAGLTANFTAIVDTNATFDLRLGGNSAVVALGAGADQIQFGSAGGQYVRGGAGGDQVTMSTTAVSIAQYNMTASAVGDTGVDTIFGASTGDIILFQGYNTAATGGPSTAGITTGTITATYGSGAGAVVLNEAFSGAERSASLQFVAMYTAAGDMVIELALTSATGASLGTGGTDFAKLVLNGKGDVAASALLRIDTNASGVFFTLL